MSDSPQSQKSIAMLAPDISSASRSELVDATSRSYVQYLDDLRMTHTADFASVRRSNARILEWPLRYRDTYRF